MAKIAPRGNDGRITVRVIGSLTRGDYIRNFIRHPFVCGTLGSEEREVRARTWFRFMSVSEDRDYVGGISREGWNDHLNR